MPTIRLNREARAAIRAEAHGPFRDTGQNEGVDGSADVPFDPETIARLEEHRHEGESYSDLIIRICATVGKPLN